MSQVNGAICLHKGPIEERRRVRTALSAVQLPVYGCKIHGKCTDHQLVPGIPGCCAPAGQEQCRSFQLDTFRHVAPIGTADIPRKWEGRAKKKPWEYTVTVTIPHLNTPELLKVVVELHRLQTEAPYFIIIDTGSPEKTCKEVELLRADDVEIHYLKSNAYPHSSAPVTAAMDVAFATCHTQYLFCTHADVFPRKRDFLAYMLSQCRATSPAVGWQMSPRQGNDHWRGTLSHTATMLHMPTMHLIGASWSMDRWYLANPHLPVCHNGWPDTESGFDACLRDWGVKKTLLGEETNFERQLTEWWDHARSITSLRLYGPGSLLAANAESYTGDALADAQARLSRWSEEVEVVSSQKALQLP